MSKVSSLSLSDRDKTPRPNGFGYHFHHTDPQRRVPCVLGHILAPLSADDIPPITPAAMTSVQAALTLLANMVGDLDLGFFLGDGNAQMAEHRRHAQHILLTAQSLAGILRVVAPMPVESPTAAPTSIVTTSAPTTSAPTTSAPTTSAPTTSTIDLHVQLNTAEITALATAYGHVRESMAHLHSWETRDTAMVAIGKVLNAARNVQEAAGMPKAAR